jgi:putative transposase
MNPPKLLSDNGACYISDELAEYLNERDMQHVRGRPLHPQTQGKIERYHRSMKNVVKLDNYYSPGQLEDKMKDFVRYYNYERYHESINNLTPSEVYYGIGERKLKRRKQIKQQTLIERKKQNHKIHLN